METMPRRNAPRVSIAKSLGSLTRNVLLRHRHELSHGVMEGFGCGRAGVIILIANHVPCVLLLGHSIYGIIESVDSQGHGSSAIGVL